MMVDPFSSTAPSSSAWALQTSMDNEKAEAVPDNEAVEIARTAKAPLQPYQGTIIDAQA
jgi:hypothetical protein